MIKFSEFIDCSKVDIAQSHRHISEIETFKEVIALANPLPAGVIVSNCTNSYHPWPWIELADIDWITTLSSHSGNIISVMLRHPRLVKNQSFLNLFRAVEPGYKKFITQMSQQAIKEDDSNGFKDAFRHLFSDVVALEIRFIQWSLKNKPLLNDSLNDFLIKDFYYQGSASDDLNRNNIQFAVQ